MDKDLMEELGLMATDSQLDYIDTLLDQVGGVLEDYTDTPLEELSKDEASDIIDEPASERLLKASAITDTAPDTNPAISLPRKSMILRTIPVHEPR